MVFIPVFHGILVESCTSPWRDIQALERSGARHLHPFPGRTRAPRRAAARIDPALRPTGCAAEGAVYSFESATSNTSNVFHARADGKHRRHQATRKCWRSPDCRVSQQKQLRCCSPVPSLIHSSDLPGSSPSGRNLAPGMHTLRGSTLMLHIPRLTNRLG